MSALRKNEQKIQEYEKLLRENQGPLLNYILAKVADPFVSKDILQETNLVIWRKIEDFEQGTHFMAWARTIAHFQVKAYFARVRRDRLVFEEDPEELLPDPHDTVDSYSLHRSILSICLQKLATEEQELIKMRYLDNGNVADIAEDLKKTPNAISQSLFRIKEKLIQCVRHQSRKSSKI